LSLLGENIFQAINFLLSGAIATGLWLSAARVQPSPQRQALGLACPTTVQRAKGPELSWQERGGPCAHSRLNRFF